MAAPASASAIVLRFSSDKLSLRYMTVHKICHTKTSLLHAYRYDPELKI